MTAPLGQIGIDTVGALDLAADVGGYAIDAFAEILRMDVVALRFSVRAAGTQAINAVERRKTDRQRAKESRAVFTKHLPRVVHDLSGYPAVGSGARSRRKRLRCEFHA